MTYYGQFNTPYLKVLWPLNKIKKECYLLRSCLIGTRRMLHFMAEQVFLPMGEVWLMHNADMQFLVVKGEEAKGRENKFF